MGCDCMLCHCCVSLRNFVAAEHACTDGMTQESLDAGAEAPQEPSTSALTSYAVTLSLADTQTSSQQSPGQLSPRNSATSQQGSDSAQNAQWQPGDSILSSSPARGRTLAS